MQKLEYLNSYLLFLICFSQFSLIISWPFNEAKNYEGSSNLVNLEYHMGPILTSPINLYIIWYGSWNSGHQATVRDFLRSLSPEGTAQVRRPSVADWWRTVRLYTDQTGGNITGDVTVAGEYFDLRYSQGKSLTRLSIQHVIKNAVAGAGDRLPLDYRNGVYLVLTSHDVEVQDFCRAVCGFHYFTFPAVVGVTVPYAWVGYSGRRCPGMCAYPFAWPEYAGRPSAPPPMTAPNGDPATDGMISVLAHELAEVSSNPLVNAWYAGDNPAAPTEIADLCVGVYGTGAGGSYVGEVYQDSWGNGFNLHGVNGRRFLVQWVWNPIKNRCFGPNAMD